MKKCILSLATKNGRYVDGLARLSNSLRDNADGIDFIGFVHEYSVGAPLHAEHPYAFKIHCLQHARNLGYDQVLWLDTSAWAVAPLQPIFDIIDKEGYFFQNNGCMLGNWSNDNLLAYAGLSRDEAMDIPMVQGGFMGLNLKKEIGKNILKQLEEAYLNGVFHGAWHNRDRTESQDERCLGHRHEQSALSAIVHFKGLKGQQGDQFVQYGGIYDKIINETIVLKCQGI